MYATKRKYNVYRRRATTRYPRRRTYGTTKRNRVAKLSTPMRNAVKKVVNSKVEMKEHYTNGFLTLNTQQVGVPFDAFFPLSNILQDVTDGGRIGDEINLHRVTLRWALGRANDSITHNIRFIVCKFYQNFTKNVLTPSRGTVQYEDLFKLVTSDYKTDILDSEKVTKLYDHTYVMSNGNGTSQTEKIFSKTFNMKGMRYKYQGDNSRYGQKYEIGILCIVNNQSLGINSSMCKVDYRDA